MPREAKLTKQTAIAIVVSVQQVAHLAVEVRTSIEATTSSIKAAAPLVNMFFTLIFASLMSSLLTYSSYCRL